MAEQQTFQQWWASNSRLTRWMTLGAGVVILYVVVSSLVSALSDVGGGNHDSQTETLRSNEALVTAEEFGDDWPLTVSAGTLRCEGPDAVTFVPEGSSIEYAVNGMATTRGAAEIEPIWAVGELSPRKNIGPLIDRGLELCG